MLKQNHVAHVPVPDERSFRETVISQQPLNVVQRLQPLRIKPRAPDLSCQYSTIYM